MKNKTKKLGAALMAGFLFVTVLGTAVPAQDTDSSEDFTGNPEAVLPDTFRPADSAVAPMESYEVPYMGLTAILPESLKEKMEQEEVFLFSDGKFTEDGSAIRYAVLSWNTMTEDQRNAEVEVQEASYTEWLNSLGRIGALGVYQTDLTGQLDELTCCDAHQKLGQSDDGTYEYYLSTSTKADRELSEQISQIQVSITKMIPLDEDYAVDSDRPTSEGTSLGEFTTQDIYGNTCTQDIFKDYDLTLVNLFATWCSPCVAEIPDLEKLHSAMADNGVNVIGVVLDAVDENGGIVPDSVEKARLLAEKTGASYPFLLPDQTYMNGRLTGIYAVPETFFVDKNGNIVGDTYSGSRSFEDWLETVELELAALKEAP